jgi:hypothetical protein
VNKITFTLECIITVFSNHNKLEADPSGRALAGIVDSNLTGGIDIRLL